MRDEEGEAVAEYRFAFCRNNSAVLACRREQERINCDNGLTRGRVQCWRGGKRRGGKKKATDRKNEWTRDFPAGALENPRAFLPRGRNSGRVINYANRGPPLLTGRGSRIKRAALARLRAES